MYRTLQGVSREFVLRGKAMYRTLLATCGSGGRVLILYKYKLPKIAEPHVASNVRYIIGRFYKLVSLESYFIN